MSDPILPRYPVYIPSRARSERCLTAQRLVKDRVPFRVVVAPSEVGAYASVYGAAVLPLPRDDMDIVAVRNWIRDHAEETGAARHWQLDDNMRVFRRVYARTKVPVDAGIALRVCEDFTDRYVNVGLSGLNYTMFVVPSTGTGQPPFKRNIHVYSCTLINHAMPYRWRGPYNDDTDLCLQVLAGGWCTILLNAFCVDKAATMTMKGGMTDANPNSYQGDGRLKMARTLERRWPGVVTTRRRFRRAQHVVKDAWNYFDTPLIRRDDLDLDSVPKVDEYGMELRAVREVKTPRLRQVLEERGGAGDLHGVVPEAAAARGMRDDSDGEAVEGEPGRAVMSGDAEGRGNQGAAEDQGATGEVVEDLSRSLTPDGG